MEVKISISEEDLKESINCLESLQPLIEKRIIHGATAMGKSKKQIEMEAKEFRKHFKTAINSMIFFLDIIDKAKRK